MSALDFIIPMMPTPDAPLHLGHICGPFLSGDVLTRIYRALDKPCVFVSGIDAFENWCEQMSPEELQEIYMKHQRAFNLFNINFDRFYNPLFGEFNQLYKISLRESFQCFKRLPGFIEKEEPVQFDSSSNSWSFGAQIIGRCLNCGEIVRGNTCAQCYFYLQPYELITPVMLEESKSTNAVMVENAFIQISESCIKYLELIGADSPALDLLVSWLKKTQGLMRLTYQGNYGVTVSLDDLRIIRNTFIQFCYALVQESLTSFESQKQSINLHLFMGFDNFIPSGAGSIELSNALDHIHIKRIELNHMLYYEGSKFSKSKKHGPRVLETLNGKDWKFRSALRVFLMQLDLTGSNFNFNENDFLKFATNYVHLIEKIKSLIPLKRDSSVHISQTEFYNRFLAIINGKPLNRHDLAKDYVHSLNLIVSNPKQCDSLNLELACKVFDPQLYSELFTI